MEAVEEKKTNYFNGNSVAKTTGKKTAPVLYVRGTNHLLDAILEEDEVVWIVNKSHGRKPVSAATASEALEKYNRLYGKDANEKA